MTARWRHLFRCQVCGNENECYTKEQYNSIGIICSECSDGQGPTPGEWVLEECEQVELPAAGVPLKAVPRDVLEAME